MTLFIDMFHVIVKKWGNNKSLVILTMINITIGAVLLCFFMNSGFNIKKFLLEQILRDETLRQVTVMPSDTAAFLTNQDVKDIGNYEGYEGARIIYEGLLPVLLIDQRDVSTDHYFITVFDKDHDFLLSSDFSYGSAWIQRNAYKESKGIVVSESALDSVGLAASDCIGKIVEFEYKGSVYKKMISGVIEDAAEQSFDKSYRTGFYVSNYGIEQADRISKIIVQIDSIHQVSPFTEKLTKSSYEVVSHYEEVQKIKRISNMIGYGFMLSGMILLVFSSLSIINTMEILVRKNIKFIGMLRTTGVPKSFFMWMFIFESFLLGIVGSAVGMIILKGFCFWLGKFVQIDFMIIPSEVFFTFNPAILFPCLTVTPLITVLCGWRAVCKANRIEIIEALKTEYNVCS